MKDFSKDILHNIEQNKIEPLPQWIFSVRQALFVGAFLISVVIGGISVSVMLFFLSDAVDVGMGNMIRVHLGPFLLSYLPYAWTAVMILFGIVAYFEMRHIKGGYRYRTAAILSASFLTSLFLGGLLHVIGAGQFIDYKVADIMPQYGGLDARKMHLWMHPQEGMLAGSIVSGSIASSLSIKDFSGSQWTIETAEATVRGEVAGIYGERVRVAGSVVRPGVFRATELFPWSDQGMMGVPSPSGRFSGKMMPMRERKNASRAY